MARHARTATPVLSSVLIGSALTVGVLSPFGAGVAAAAPSDPACVAVAHRQHDFVAAQDAYNKQKGVFTAAQARYERLLTDPNATAAQIEAARLDAEQAAKRMNLLYSAVGAANTALQDSVAAAHDKDCETGPGGQPTSGGTGTVGSGAGGPGVGSGWRPKPHPKHGRRPVPVTTVVGSSSASSTAVVISAPVGGANAVSPSASNSGWLDRVGDWFEEPRHTTAESTSTAARDAEPDALPVTAADTSDGSRSDLDAGHIGLAVVGLSGLGLAGAAGAALGRRRRPR